MVVLAYFSSVFNQEQKACVLKHFLKKKVTWIHQMQLREP